MEYTTHARTHSESMQANSGSQQDRLAKVVKIYYENHVHKKFLADVYAVIPKGKKCVIWFTNNQCWVLQIAKRPNHPPTPHNSHNSRSESVTFDHVRKLNVQGMGGEWCRGNGTILYGTYMFDKMRFSVENVHYLCGTKQQHDGSMSRFVDFFDALKTCKMELPLQFFMPIMHTSFNDALKDALAIKSYDVFCIQHRFLQRDCTEYKNLLMHLAEQPSTIQPHQHHQQPHQQQQPQQQQQQTHSFFPRQANAIMPTTATATATVPMHKVATQRIFFIKPDVQNDIYYVLHDKDAPITDKTMIAHIPNYKISVMMNSIFRNIKENRNLDALEESDDEDERSDYVLDANKSVLVTCIFNHRFKRWQPCACA